MTPDTAGAPYAHEHTGSAPFRTRDAERLARIVSELPTLYAELVAIGETPATNHDTQTRRPVPGSRPPINLERLTLTDPRFEDSALRILTAWTHHTAREARTNNVDLPDMTETPSVESECAWLAQVQWHVIHQPHAHQLLADLATLHNRIRNHLNYQHITWPCPEHGCQDNAEITSDRRHLLCPNQHLTDGPLLLIARWLRHPGMTEKEICAEFGIPRGTFSAWATRRRVKRITADGVRPVLYHPWDALILHRPQLVKVAQDLGKDAA